MKATIEEVELFKQCNPNELDTVISDYFRAVTELESRIIIYTNKAPLIYREDKGKVIEEKTLKIAYNKENIIKSIEYSDEETFRLIIQSINCLLYEELLKYEKLYLFTSEQLKDEYFVFQNKILLRPAEHQNQINNHWFLAVLEFSYKGSSHIWIDMNRKQRHLSELIWLMNLLFKFKVKKDSELLLTTELNGLKLIPIISVLPEIEPNGLNLQILFERFNIVPLGMSDDISYYSSFGFQTGLRVGLKSRDILTKFFNGSKENGVLIKTAYWFSKAVLNLNSDTSNVILGITTSLECIVNDVIEIMKNEGSDLPRKEDGQVSISKMIRIVIDKYLPGFFQENTPQQKTITNFYQIRSDIVHGNILPFKDVPNERVFDPIINEIRRLDYYIVCTRLIILNWYTKGEYDEYLKYFNHSSFMGQPWQIGL